MNRWVVYQRERFPLLRHAALVAAFSASAVCFSSLLRGPIAPPSWSSLLVAFVTSLLVFLQLRVLDEFKDRDADRRYRPYRPVPRGLVSLRELGLVAALAAVVQMGLAVWLNPSLVPLLVIIWAYLALMSREFFASAWLRSHPLAYMASHMVILPLTDFYATACDWWVAGLSRPPAGLSMFLAVSFLNGMVVEIGRKTRAPRDEEAGVETYSALWGMTGAIHAWISALIVTGLAAWFAARSVGAATAMAALLALMIATCAAGAVRFLRSPQPGSGRLVEIMSGVWTVAMYLGLGVGPLMMALW